MQLLDRQHAWGAVGAGIETGVMFQKSLALADLLVSPNSGGEFPVAML